DATGTLSATSAPDTAYYLFSGVLLLPLALLGLRDPRSRVIGLFITLPALWYMLGPAFGFYRIGEIIPFLHQVRAPIHGWFAVVFGLSILAAAGAGRLVAWLPVPPPKTQWIAALLAGVIFVDLYYWNSLVHPSAYARASWDSTYGALTENTRLKIQSTQPPSTRLDAPDKIAALGPLNHPLDLNLETTYGYNPLALTRYEEYRAVVAQNPKLLPAMNVSRRLDLRLGGIVPVDKPLPRAYFSRSVVSVPDDTQSRQQLATLDPAATTTTTTTPDATTTTTRSPSAIGPPHPLLSESPSPTSLAGPPPSMASFSRSIAPTTPFSGSSSPLEKRNCSSSFTPLALPSA
ncbi:MAG: hypothetical protein B7X34_00175, partial [Acidobacteriia bacterium 12-62-4]